MIGSLCSTVSKTYCFTYRRIQMKVQQLVIGVTQAILSEIYYHFKLLTVKEENKQKSWIFRLQQVQLPSVYFLSCHTVCGIYEP